MSPGVIWRFLRPATLPAVVAGVAGGAIAAQGGWPDTWVPLLAAVASALLLTGASNGINQIADIDTDRVNRPERPLPAGQASVRDAWVLVLALCGLSFVLASLVNLAYLLCIMADGPR